MTVERLGEVPFEPSAGGWIFKLNHPLLLGPPRYVFVNAAQKAAIAAELESIRVIRAAIVLPAILAAAPVAAALPRPEVSSWAGVLLALVFLYALFTAVNVFGCVRLRPLLAGLPRAEGNIGLASQLRDAAWHLPFPFHFLFFSVFASDVILSAAMLGHRSLLQHGAGVFAYGLGAVLWGALIVAKLLAKQQE
jgi:hypothetical protein